MLHAGDADDLAVAFGLGSGARLIGPVDRGELGQVWRLEAGGRVLAVKEPFGPIDDAQLEVAWALPTRAAAYGVGVPRPLRPADGRAAVQLRGVPLRAYDWVELAAPSRALDATAVGTTLAAIHRAGLPTPGPVDPWYVEPVGVERWAGLAQDLDRGGAPFAGSIRALLPELARTEAILRRPGRELIGSHRDLWADNVRAGTDGSVVVIDWDNGGPVEPAQELAMVLVEFGTTEVRARTLYAAYRAAGGPATLTGASDFTMVVAVLHHLVELAASRWLTAADDVDRRRAESGVAEFVDDPITLEVVDGLLAAVVDVG